MREVKSVETKRPSIIRMTTVSGSVYEFGAANHRGERTLYKSGLTCKGILAVTLTGAQFAEQFNGTKVAICVPLSDGRVIVPADMLEIGDCIGFLFEERGKLAGIASSQIEKIEIE